MVYPRVSLYALMLAAAGIPLYIHLPRFAAINLGIGLGTIGTILLLIRLIDLVQDPVIGWAIDRWPKAQGIFSLTAAGGLAIGFPLLFSPRSGANVVTPTCSNTDTTFLCIQYWIDIALWAQCEPCQTTRTNRDDEVGSFSRGWNVGWCCTCRYCPCGIRGLRCLGWWLSSIWRFFGCSCSGGRQLLRDQFGNVR